AAGRAHGDRQPAGDEVIPAGKSKDKLRTRGLPWPTMVWTCSHALVTGNVHDDLSFEASMPLLDHFHPPLLGQRHWEGFHGWWATAIAGELNEHLLPPEFFAEFQVTVGTRIEIDVATFSEDGMSDASRPNGASTAVQTQVWAPPAPVAVMPALFPDDFEV